MKINLIVACSVLYITVCFACQTNNDCSLYRTLGGNDTARLCCQIFGNPRKCVTFSQCFQIPIMQPKPTKKIPKAWRHKRRNRHTKKMPKTWPTWSPRSTYNKPEIPTWHEEAWPTIHNEELPDIDWTPEPITFDFPASDFDPGPDHFSTYSPAFAVFALGIVIRCIIWLDCRSRRNQQQLLIVTELQDQSQENDVTQVPLEQRETVDTADEYCGGGIHEKDAPYSAHNHVAVDMETPPYDVTPLLSNEQACGDVTQSSTEDVLPNHPPPRYEDIV